MDFTLPAVAVAEHPSPSLTDAERWLDRFAAEEWYEAHGQGD